MAARVARNLLRAVLLACAVIGAGWAGCRCRPTPPKTGSEAEPTLTLILVSSVAGALEPCGCVEDMLGGIDHFAAQIKKGKAASTLVLGAGPMLFAEPEPSLERKAQDLWKAEAMAQALRDVGMRAWAPGANDFSLGAGELSRLTQAGPALAAANLKVEGVATRDTLVYSVGGVRVGVAGLALPLRQGSPPAGVVAPEPEDRARTLLTALEAEHATIKVLLVAMERGRALRMAESVPGFHVMLVGKPYDQGEGNDPVVPLTHVGETLVVQGQNHLQSLYQLDFFLKQGSPRLINASEGEERRADLGRRIRELSESITRAEKSGARASDLEARKRDLGALEKERAALPTNPEAPQGSYYRARLIEIREALGSEPTVARRLDQYYRRVNDHNRVAFAERAPPAVPDGQSHYVGAETCANCHVDEHAFWQKTRHVTAYATLERQHKQFNLDCVGCHVTAYDQPGGSTVVQVGVLEAVQCEECHGPGSGHVEDPSDLARIDGSPSRDFCGPRCHHVPHVKPDWSVDLAFSHIVGPGHRREPAPSGP